MLLANTIVVRSCCQVSSFSKLPNVVRSGALCAIDTPDIEFVAGREVRAIRRIFLRHQNGFYLSIGGFPGSNQLSEMPRTGCVTIIQEQVLWWLLCI